MATIKLGAGIQTAPGVYTREFDITQTVDSGASTEAGIAGVFSWGPVEQPVLIGDKNALVAKFGKPTNANFETFYASDGFLTYGNALYVNRVVDSNAASAVANSGAVSNAAVYLVKNEADYDVKASGFTNAVQFIARYPGSKGNSLKVSVCGSVDQYSSSVNLQANALFASANTKAVFTVGSNTAVVTLANTGALTGNTPNTAIAAVASALTVGDYITIGNTSIGTQDLKITAIGTPLIVNTAGTNTGVATMSLSFEQPVKIAADFSANSLLRTWEFASLVDTPPKSTWTVASSGNTAAVDGMHVVVVDEDGAFSSRAGAILEVYQNVSRATDGKSMDGDVNYVKDVINQKSNYIWYAAPITGYTVNTAINIASVTATTPFSVSFTAGADGADESTISIASIGNGYNAFANRNEYPLSALIVGKTRGGLYGEQIFNYIIDNIAEQRVDLVVYGSPARSAVIGNSSPVDGVKNFRSALRSSSYATCDSGYKYIYDSYNDTYRYVPLCGDIAGISALTDVTNDPWYSPAGYNRGQIRNIIKLAWNPTAAEQKVLFNNDINPVITIRGEGTYLMGDKTLVGYNSAFDAIGVRKLFNIIKRNIAEASRLTLFEFNDEFSQARFRNLVEPYLRDVQGRRGITAFKVICDDSNNGQQVKTSKQFVGDIYVVPANSIRTIHLNFVGVNTLADFAESVA